MTIGIITAMWLVSCGEIEQDGPKPFAGREEVRSYAGPPFDGNKALYEKALRERAETQDEALRLPHP